VGGYPHGSTLAAAWRSCFIPRRTTRSERKPGSLRRTEYDPAVREEVRSLSPRDPAMASSARQAAAAGQDAAATGGPGLSCPGPGQRIGPYLTQRLLGSVGGMGKVFLARRADGQFEQTGRAQSDGRSPGRRRFVRGLSPTSGSCWPPSLIPISPACLDGGVASQRRPLSGDGGTSRALPLDQYCAQRKLPVEARIRLFSFRYAMPSSLRTGT